MPSRFMRCTVARNSTDLVRARMCRQSDYGFCIDFFHPFRQLEGKHLQQAGEQDEELDPRQLLPHTGTDSCRSSEGNAATERHHTKSESVFFVDKYTMDRAYSQAKYGQSPRCVESYVFSPLYRSMHIGKTEQNSILDWMVASCCCLLTNVQAGNSKTHAQRKSWRCCHRNEHVKHLAFVVICEAWPVLVGWWEGLLFWVCWNALWIVNLNSWKVCAS